MIALKRAYETASGSDGKRFLVERLWPRGLKKDALQIDGWLKDAAPSTDLRKWFNHDPAKWSEFRRRYYAELESHPGALQPLLDAARGKLTLVYSSRDEQHNNAVALKEYLQRKLAHARPRPKRAA